MTFTKIELAFYTSAVALVFAAAGWLANHRLATDRDKRTRRGVFLGYLGKWKSGIVRKTHSFDVFAAYREGVHDFHLELGKISEDYRGDRNFIETATALGALTENEIIRNGLDGRIPIFTLLDRLVTLTK